MSVATSTACPAAEGCIEACERATQAVAHVGPVPGAYATVGPHLRHCIDHFTCFFRGVETGTIHYDARDREPGLESNPGEFRAAIKAVIERLKKIDADKAASSVYVCQIPAPGQAAIMVESTLDRELLFLSGHTIHHLAIIGELAQAFGVSLPPRLCLAYSTAAHRAEMDGGK
ncbi:MAG: hypothetical protein AMXMBFR4_18930 [Candidatus Hydrogenedentota bacterium]